LKTHRNGGRVVYYTAVGSAIGESCASFIAQALGGENHQGASQLCLKGLFSAVMLVIPYYPSAFACAKGYSTKHLFRQNRRCPQPNRTGLVAF